MRGGLGKLEESTVEAPPPKRRDFLKEWNRLQRQSASLPPDKDNDQAHMRLEGSIVDRSACSDDVSQEKKRSCEEAGGAPPPPGPPRYSFSPSYGSNSHQNETKKDFRTLRPPEPIPGLISEMSIF